jgi:hypothetical protein
MSGEAVLIGTGAIGGSGLAIAGGFGVAIIASVAWNTMMNIKKQREQEAIVQLKLKKSKTDEWQFFQQHQQQNMEAISLAQDGILKGLKELELVVKNSHSNESAKTSQQQEKGFVSSKFDYTHYQDKLEKILAFIGQTKSNIPKTEYSLVDKLYSQTLLLIENCHSTTPPAEEQILSFQQTVENSIQLLLTQLEEQAQYNKEMLKRSELLLNNVFSSEVLTNDSILLKQLHNIKKQLKQFLQTGKISIADVSLLENHFMQLQTKIEINLEQEIVRDTLNETIRRNMDELGYSTRSISDESTVWDIPGGEQVKMALHKNNQIAFQFMHERETHQKQAISDEERAFIRQQEKRWCSDLSELTKRLVAEGLQYQVQFERESLAETIPIVVVEDIDSLLEKTATGAEAKQLHQQLTNSES